MYDFIAQLGLPRLQNKSYRIGSNSHFYRQCHTEMERVCTKEAVTRVPERVLPSRVIEVPMTQVPTKVDVDVFVRSLGKYQ